MRYLVILILLVACTGGAPQPPAPAPTPPPDADTCNAAQMANFVGSAVTRLETKLLLQPVRITRPGDAVTEDLLPTRINFLLDENEIIRSITCG